MGLIAGNYTNPSQRRCKNVSIDSCGLVVLLRYHLFIIGIRPFDEASINLCRSTLESEVIITTSDLDLVFGPK